MVTVARQPAVLAFAVHDTDIVAQPASIVRSNDHQAKVNQLRSKVNSKDKPSITMKPRLVRNIPPAVLNEAAH